MNSTLKRFSLLVLLLFAFSACDKKSTAQDPSANELPSEQPAEVAKQELEEQKAEEPAPADVAEADNTKTDLPADSPLLHPDKAVLVAPDKFKAKFITTQGDFIVDIDKSLSPKGVDRFYNLAKIGFYNDVKFFRVIEGFMAQFGMNGDPSVSAVWKDATIDDEPVKASNTRGYITFAKTGAPNSRTSQLFINFGDNANLDSMGFAPFGKIDDEGMKIVDKIYNGYGEGAPRGAGPRQDLIMSKGNEYLKAEFPKLDSIKSIEIVE